MKRADKHSCWKLKQKMKKISELESENQKLKEVEELYNKNIEEIENYKKKEEEYNSKSFFYRLTHKF